jgi:hypothetical protein
MLPKIVIHTDADFTPKGTRTARVVTTRGRFGNGRQLRWYVAGRLYRRLSVTTENAKLTNEWLKA